MGNAPIEAFVGSNGNGKTLGMTYFVALRSLEQGRPVWANYNIDHPLAHRLRHWTDLDKLHDCTLCLTEISSAFASRATGSLPHEIVAKLHQLRKPDVDVAWDAVNWKRADIVLREATTSVTTCEGFFEDAYLRTEQIPGPFKLNRPPQLDENGKKKLDPATWKSNRLFRYRTYNTEAFDQFTIHAIKNVKPKKTRWLYRPWHDADLLYDTLEEIPLVENLTETGVCLICGGMRRRPTCHGHPVSAEPSPRRVAALRNGIGPEHEEPDHETETARPT